MDGRPLYIVFSINFTRFCFILILRAFVLFFLLLFQDAKIPHLGLKSVSKLSVAICQHPACYAKVLGGFVMQVCLAIY